MTVLPTFLTDPGADYWLSNARLPLACLDASVPWATPLTDLARLPWQEDLVAANLRIQSGRITAIQPMPLERPTDQEMPTDQPSWDLRQGLVWPCFVDSHTHLDKAHLWPRNANPTGTFRDALQGVREDYRHWSLEDLYPRMEFALRCSYAHGTQAIRTHLDGLASQNFVNFAVFEQLRSAWADKITLQAVCLVSLEAYAGTAGEALADQVAAYGGILGGVIHPQPHLAERIERVFHLAQARGLAIDFHADESLDPTAAGLRLVAETKLRLNFSGPVTCGHCCSLSVQAEDRVNATLDLVKLAAISVISLPMCNLYLQDRQAGRTPQYRGVTRLSELRAAGVPVALSSDNCRDPFYAYGDHDVLEVFTQGVRIGHLDHPFGPWPQAVTTTPAQIMGLADIGPIGVGRSADLLLFKARTLNELLSRPQSDRIVLRQGIAIDTTLPDYGELDELLASR